MKAEMITAQFTRLKHSLTRRRRQRSGSPDPTWVYVDSLRPSFPRLTGNLSTHTLSVDKIFPITFDPPPIDPSHNEKLAINRLPAEILADIFLRVCEACVFPDHTWTACSQVCSAWRAIALDTPTLWSHVIFTGRTPAWTRRCIERSKSAPLIIEANMADNRTGLVVEQRVCQVLAWQSTNRIWKIHIQFFALSQALAITLLNGPFPILNSLAVNFDSDYFSSPTLTLNPDAYPMLRHLQFQGNVTFFPAHLPLGLVSLEVSNGSDGSVSWEGFWASLELLADLETLTLHEFAVPPASAGVHTIKLPKLRELHLSASPADCAQLIEALDAPHLRRYGLHLCTVEHVDDMFEAILGNLAHPAPKSMFLHRQYGTLGSDLYHVSQPFPDPGFYQHTVFGFAYADARDAGEVATLDICFSWRIPLTDLDLAAIFAAVSAIPVLDCVEWLLLADWNNSPPGTWHALLRQLTRLRNLVISGLPASGLVWDLLNQLESPAPVSEAADAPPQEGSEPLLPALVELEINSVDCSAGGWIARCLPNQVQRTVNSYIDLDGARFIEVLVCYLEQRKQLHVALPRLKVTRALNYSVVEIKYLRTLVGEVLWDGVGPIPSTYAYNGDEFGAMTINHNLLSRRKSYRELDLGEEERWRKQFWTLQMRDSG